MSADGFIRRFQRLMGISFTEFAIRQRISGAADDLARGNEPVKAIARNWGFTDESHRHRLFVRYYGSSPARYRESTQCYLR